MNSEETLSAALPEGPHGRFADACRVLDEAIAARAFPGCAFGVLAGGEVALLGARGRFTYDEASSAVTPETVYDVASITKVAATTAAAMLLHQRGLLQLETPLGKLLPDFLASRSADDRARGITLRHLLAHNSGLPGYVEFFRTAATAGALLEACLKLPLKADPGACAEYSDPGFILLGKALEALTGESLSAWVRREVFQPLGLTATGFMESHPSDKNKGVARVGHPVFSSGFNRFSAEARALIPPTEEDTAFRHRIIQGEVQDENAWLLGGAAGHAGVFSNVPDLLRFAREILDAVSNSGNARIFNAETVHLFAQRQGPPGSSRALGWDTPSQPSSSGRHFSPHSIGHLGFSGCSLWIDLEAGVAVTLLTNRTWPDRASQLIRQVRPAFHDAIRQAL
jgi:CubicO group peptidase (beta-lactamase class C family)